MNAPSELSLFLCFVPPKIDNTRMREELVQLIIERLVRDSDCIRADFAATKDVTAHYTAIDDLLPIEIAGKIAAAFPASEQMRLMDSFRERKFTSKSLDK